MRFRGVMGKDNIGIYLMDICTMTASNFDGIGMILDGFHFLNEMTFSTYERYLTLVTFLQICQLGIIEDLASNLTSDRAWWVVLGMTGSRGRTDGVPLFEWPER